MKNIAFFITFIAVCSCSKSQTMHGTNPQNIAGFLNLKTYKPTAVEYHLTRLGDGRLGPSDYTLEAVLYYDAATFAKLKKKYYSINYTAPDKSSKDFDFKWLPKAVKDELAKSLKEYTGHPGAVLSRNPNCMLWFLSNKVLVSYFTM
ncbi:hypothetical protein HH214_16345 [Mucilaginibacter robiniae]|uniref:Lipoprotein n=1 Tax=Mucilaginibacter robiniae TaxID=2728022 RepID=A0A7L5E2F6_9SPHI|nr:hypothetical protein [Mucilaginibacter robiniae]QJD97325.1 hypothetical protein HH214_16345 [Mucilaginibacter robiniae]